MDTKRTVLITGCSQGGIGDALAHEFHRRGLRVFASARDLAKIQHLKDKGLETVQLDVTDQASIAAAVETIADLTDGTLDILVNNAGHGYQAPLLDADLDKARKLFDVNLWGLLAVTQAFSPLLRATSVKGGDHARVLNIGSVVSRASVPWQGVYNASKGALFILNDTMRLELGLLDIDVLQVVTGGVDTNFSANNVGAGTGIPKSSLYAPVAGEIEATLTGTAGSHTGSVPAERYARAVVANTLKRRPTRNLWCGGSSLSTYLGQVFGWDSIRDRIMSRMFHIVGLREKLEKAGREQSQQQS